MDGTGLPPGEARSRAEFREWIGRMRAALDLIMAKANGDPYLYIWPSCTAA